MGYSGGPDSTCLVHLLHRGGFDIVAAHLHHGQREEAEMEMRLCEAFCQALDIPFVSGKADVPQMSREMKIGLEEAGRNARYEFFRQAKMRLSCDLIATAHTLDDHVETVLLNLTRGTGLAGLSGISALRGDIVRPLLAFSREDTRAYCEQEGLWTHDDPANRDISFSRARIRHRVLPQLRSINPSVNEAIGRLASIAEEEDRMMDGMAASALERSESRVNGDLEFLTRDCEAFFDRQLLMHLPPVLLRRAVRLAMRAVGGALDFDQASQVVERLATDERGSVTAEGGEVVLEWDLETITVRQLKPSEPFRYNVTYPGETISDEFSWLIRAIPGQSVPDQVRASLEVSIDSKRISGQLYFRTVKPGDMIQPLGFEGTRKVADLLSEAHLSQAARRRLPIICDMIGPIWVPGVCLSERVRSTAGTVEAISLYFGPLIQDDETAKTP